MSSKLGVIETRLGRRIDPRDEGSITNLNAVPESLVREARSIGNILLANELLRFYTSPECHGRLRSFVQQVVFGDAAPQSWRRGRTLVPSFSMEQQIVLPRSELLAPVGGDFELRIVPRAADWQAGVEWVGAPARPDPDADYRSTRPENSADLDDAEVEAVVNPDLTIRRWIAARIARVLEARGRLREDADLTQDFPARARWTEDALAAGEALLRELRDPALPPGIPGFRGPDEWYRG